MTADTYSTDGLGLLLMGTGNDNNTWGANCNTNVFQILADAITNTLSSGVTGGTLDLSGSPPPATSSQVRYAGLIFTGVLGSNQLVQVPNLNKWWLVKNATSGAFTLKFKTSGGSASTAIPQNSGWQLVRCDGSNVIEVWPFNTKQIQMPDGTVSLPAYANLTEPSSGWYRAGTQDWRFSINGVDVLQVTGTGASSPSILSVLSPNTLQTNAFNITSTDAAAATAPPLDLFRDSASPAASDFIGSVDFNGRDSAGNKQLYAQILAQITDPVSTTEDAILILRAVVAGTLTDMLKTSAAGITIPGTLDVTGTSTLAAVAATSVASSGAVSGTTITGTGAVSGATAAGAMVATQANQESASATNLLVSPGRQQFHPSAAKMWGYATVTTGTPTMQVAYNMTSITDTALGRLTLTIATDFSDGNWCCQATTGVGTTLGLGNNLSVHPSVPTAAAGSVELSCANAGNALTDPDAWYWAGFGDQA